MNCIFFSREVSVYNQHDEKAIPAFGPSQNHVSILTFKINLLLQWYFYY